MTEGQPVVLVTGANGFVGRHLSAMLGDKAWTVRRAQRVLTGGAQEVQIGSIGPQTDWRAALDGVSAVVHLAARVHHPNEENAGEIYRTINTEGTLQLARSAAAAGVQRFIYLSTILVNGATSEGRGPFREDDDPKPRGVYGLSKAVAESGLAAIAGETGMQVSIIRPPLIYGRGAVGNFRLLVKMVRLGVPLPFASIRNRRAFLGVQNLSSFIAHRLVAPELVGHGAVHEQRVGTVAVAVGERLRERLTTHEERQVHVGEGGRRSRVSDLQLGRGRLDEPCALEHADFAGPDRVGG